MLTCNCGRICCCQKYYALFKAPSLFILPATSDFQASVLNVEGPHLNDLFNTISPLCFIHCFKKETGLIESINPIFMIIIAEASER